MKYLGIDYGTKRTGIALSDDDGMMAFPREVLAVTTEEKLVADIGVICKEEGVEEIVVGESKNSEGEYNAVMKHIAPLKEKLEKVLGLPVHLELEFMTSMHADIGQGRTKLRDASAAALILQRYLDKQKKSSILDD